jgi:hypothetical protein
MWSSAQQKNDRRLLLTQPLSSLDSQELLMHHQIRAPTITNVTETKILVDRFEILKQKSSTAIENITILSPAVRGEAISSEKSPCILEDDLRPHQQRPWETEDDGNRLQTISWVNILVEVVRLPKCVQSGTKT